jgi:two-component system, OmpR family, alkaline phosphatase synthesis response regulator PhoP
LYIFVNKIVKLKIAIVEDEENIANLIALVLKELTTNIIKFDNGWKAIDGLLVDSYQLIILDVMLPGVNGYEICRKLRASGVKAPILMLTAKSEEDDKVNGLEIGADDYITKPFSNKELLARAKALLRRAESNSLQELKKEEAIKIGDLVINPLSRSLFKRSKEIELTAKEFDLLYLFMENAGRNFSRMDLLERVWGENFEGLEHTVNSNINRIRMKLEDDAAKPKYLLTVWGVGYKFAKNPEL